MLPSVVRDTVAWPLSRSSELVRGFLGGLTWGPGLAVAKPVVMSVLSQIEVGTLTLVDEPAEKKTVFGEKLPVRKGDTPTNGANGTNGVNGVNGTGELKTNGAQHGTSTAARSTSLARPRVELRVKSDAFWMRVFLFADMGFSEAYMLGEVECDNLTLFFSLFIRNREQLGNGTTRFSAVAQTLSTLARNTNTLSNALLNVSAHYDISNDMFAAFLSPDMTYSCPVWASDAAGAEHESLEVAQMRKLDRFIDGARLQSTDHVLEIGTGWGSLAMRAVQRTGCRVTTLTLSREQKALAEERIAATGLADRIRVLLVDYRTLDAEAADAGAGKTSPASPACYDKIISIEMLEAVGQEFLATYFACIHRLLKRDGGIAVFQCITMPEGRHAAYSKGEDFINHYIFPGGYLPSITQLLNHISTQSAGTLIVERVENIGGHYAKTLRLWRENFLAHFEAQIRPALAREHPGMSDAEMQVFRRKWEYYFAYCEAGFATKTLGDVIITVGREGAMELMDGVPL